MQQYKIEIQNLKCGGCENSIKNSLLKLNGVLDTQIDNETSVVTVVHNGKIERTKIVNQLKSLGYPEKNTVNGLESVMLNTKSFVSCAIGKMSE